MKKIFMLSILAILTITLVGCGNNTTSQGGSAGKIENITLKEALTKKGTHIWYEISTDRDESFRLDKEQTISKVYIFKDNKVWITELMGKKREDKDIYGNDRYSSSTLAEVSKMTDEEIIKNAEDYLKIREKRLDNEYQYNTAKCNECIDPVNCDYCSRAKNNLEEKEALKIKYETFTFGIETDSTGNNTQTEYFSTKTNKKIWADGNIMGNYGPYQIYDTYFCGYQDYDFYDGDFDDDVFVTKCKRNTFYTFDKVGTKGIAIDED